VAEDDRQRAGHVRRRLQTAAAATAALWGAVEPKEECGRGGAVSEKRWRG